jgi:D-alanyl-D-alanine carboxypeptidase
MSGRNQTTPASFSGGLDSQWTPNFILCSVPTVAADGVILQEALASSGQEHGPGLFGLVTEGRNVVFEGSVGVADTEHPRPIRAQDLFRIGSVTKTYIAALVLQLTDQDTLSLADPVQRWLPGAVPGGELITVEMLLRMRSGLPDYVRLIYGSSPDLGVLDRYWSPEELVAMSLTADDDRLQPDARYRYSNTDYVLLGLIAEKATGQRVDAQLWQRIFKPLGLNDTVFPTVDPHIRGRHAKVTYGMSQPRRTWSSRP